MKIDAKMISGAMAAEEALSRKENRWVDDVVDSLPDGSPVKDAANQLKAQTDLAGLPPSHPLFKILEEERLRYEAKMAEQAESQKSEAEVDVTAIRRAKRVDAKKARQKARLKEEEDGRKIQAAVNLYNGSLAETMKMVQHLRKNMMASQEDFKDSYYASHKMARLERMLIAFERGIADSKLVAGRVTNG